MNQEKPPGRHHHHHHHEPPPYREINEYAQSLVPERPEEVRRMEEMAMTEHFPIIGPACGHLCYLLARMTGARQIFELGSGFGYSTYWFARAVRENGGGMVHHTAWDAGLSDRARTHLDRLGLSGLVTFHVAEAVATLRRVGGEFDLLFCDIDKHAYAEALVEMEKHLKPGGMVIFDNMLLGGSVLPSWAAKAPPPTDDPEMMKHRARHAEGLRAIEQTTEMLFRSDSWLASFIPLRDGMAVAVKVAPEKGQADPDPKKGNI